MKVLMLTPYLPFPPSSGGQVRSYNLLKHLSKKHRITLYSLIKTDSEKKFVKELKKYCYRIEVFKRTKNPWTIRNILKTGFGTYPFLVIRNLVPEERIALKKELDTKRYDLIHAETFYVMPHIPETKIPVLLVDQTIEYLVYKHYVSVQAPVFLRPLFSVDVAKLKFWEKAYWQKASKVVAVSEADKKKMLKLSPGLNVRIVPNGVALDFFKVKKSWSAKTPKILFVANFKWLQNTEAARILIDVVYPFVVKELPEVKLWIVGQHIPSDIKKMAGEKIIISDIPSSDQKTIQEAYEKSSVFVSPLRGPGGTRLKHFAAMAAKLPLVTTKVGAEGLNAKDGVHLIVRDKPQELAEQTIILLKNPDKAREMTERARAFVQKNFSWEKMAEKLDKIYQETAYEK